MAAPDVIKDLVARFHEHRDDYVAGNLGETEVRVQFINPFFKALGWDVENEQGYAEAYKDVVHEDAVKVAGNTKAPDYSFRVGGVRKFFLEAKKPSVYIKGDPHPAYQLRRYAWSAKLPVSVLTDFEEFAVYDCRVRPNEKDGASVARTLYLQYTDYEEKWDEIASVFSKDAVLKGSFDKYADSKKKKRGTAEVDDAFLGEIESWREALAKNLAIRNPKLTQRELNTAVQLTIDRIIFLRICEDRGIEHYRQLQALTNGKNIYGRLFELFGKADDRYNSGLFYFKPEKGRSGHPDTLTPSLEVDDKVLKEILGRLYYPESPYEFSVLPADILGQVYERFLGKVIRLTQGHQAKVEEKPEVRKAGGVYYTPTYIVDYIVKNTVGKLLEGKTPKEAAKLKILDPACGSGSFLLGAYQYLLGWHLAWYSANDPQKHAKGKRPVIYQTRQDEWRLTTAEKKRILTDNIYGVDIDAQAVEVTKLSLLLKVLEGESEETIGKNFSLFHERALPDLSSNIKCGNSLIGSDFYAGTGQGNLPGMMNEEEKYRINAFDWDKEFPEIFSGKNPGFDAVIGNPPYIRIQTLKEWAPAEVEHYKKAYKSAASGNYDIYVVFVERGLFLLHKDGLLGFILPHKFFNAQYGGSLRQIIAKGRHLAEIVYFGDQQVFEGATTYTCLLFLCKTGNDDFVLKRVTDVDGWRRNDAAAMGSLAADEISGAEWNFHVGGMRDIFSRLTQFKCHLSDVALKIFQGLVTGADSVFILLQEGNTSVYSEATGKNYRLEKELLHPLLKGSVNIRRYHVADVSKVILFPYHVSNGCAVLISPTEFKEKYPRTWAYLQECRERLESRERGKWKHDKWYALGRSQNLTEMEQRKLLTPSIASSASFAFDDDHYYFVGSGGGGGGGYGITLRGDCEISEKYVLGLLNSTLLDAYLKAHSSPFSHGYYAYNRQYIERLPIRTINFSDKKDKARHDKMVELVESMLSLHKQLAAAKTDHEKTVLQRQIDATDRQIDELVYELYELTPEEIKIVEEGVK